MVLAQRGLLERFQSVFPVSRKVIWFHVSSLGEFEQGRPVIELWKKKRPEDFILLTFFSPSGYEIRRNYQFADYVDYLPFDSSYRIKRYVQIIDPVAFMLVKYDFWPNLLGALYTKKVSVFLFSAVFRPDQIFFRNYGFFFLNLIRQMDKIFVQDQDSKSLLVGKGINQVEIAGDTRIDSVLGLADHSDDLEHIKDFTGSSIVIIGGSTWDVEEKYLATFMNETMGQISGEKIKILLAPHDIREHRLRSIESLYGESVIRYSSWIQNRDSNSLKRVLLIDQIGLLIKLYKYADIAFIGGGFGRSIHNILEPAVYGLPIIIGPNYSKFSEAKKLVENGGVFSIKKYSEFRSILSELFVDKNKLSFAGGASRAYINNSAGATALITSCLLENT